MSIEVLYLLRKDEPGAALRELDDVQVLVDVTTDDGDTIAAGTEGTVVSVVGERVIVEFAEPTGALADIDGANVRRVGRHAR